MIGDFAVAVEELVEAGKFTALAVALALLPLFVADDLLVSGGLL